MPPFLKKFGLQFRSLITARNPAAKKANQGKQKTRSAALRYPKISCNATQGELRLSGLSSFCDSLQEQMSLAVEAQPAPQPNFSIECVQNLELFHNIQATVQKIQGFCSTHGAHPGELPVKTLRAWQWLVFLSDPEKLAAHFSALQRFNTSAKMHMLPKNPKPNAAPLRLQINFFNIPALYRSRYKNSLVSITAHEGFIYAPQETLESLANLALRNADRGALHRLRSYADSPEFNQVSMIISRIDQNHELSAQGKFHNLQQVYQRVIQTYFAPDFEAPRLTWNQRLTYHKFGHYQPGSDTVMVSISLDRPETPNYVLDFVMYHELLHKYFGIHTGQSRRYAHHRAFREKERQFLHYDQAQAYLNLLGTKIARAKRK